jgi:hypothetical protein
MPCVGEREKKEIMEMARWGVERGVGGRGCHAWPRGKGGKRNERGKMGRKKNKLKGSSKSKRLAEGTQGGSGWEEKIWD